METKEKEGKEVEVVKEQEEVQESTVETTATKSAKDIARELVKAGCKMFSNVVVKNVNVTDKDDYVMVTFTTRNQLPGMIQDELGEYKEGLTNVVFSSNFALAGVTKEKEGYAWLGNYIATKPQMCQLLFSEAKLTLIQQRLSAGEVYHNPFSTNENKENIIQNDTIFYHIVDFELSKGGKAFMNRILDAMTMKILEE